MGSMMGSQNIMGSDNGSNISTSIHLQIVQASLFTAYTVTYCKLTK